MPKVEDETETQLKYYHVQAVSQLLYGTLGCQQVYLEVSLGKDEIYEDSQGLRQRRLI